MQTIKKYFKYISFLYLLCVFINAQIAAQAWPTTLDAWA